MLCEQDKATKDVNCCHLSAEHASAAKLQVVTSQCRSAGSSHVVSPHTQGRVERSGISKASLHAADRNDGATSTRRPCDDLVRP